MNAYTSPDATTASNPNDSRRFDIEGRNLGFPTLFHDGFSCMGIFSVPVAVANDIIADSGFEVEEIAPGKAGFSLICVHYEDTECGVYNEIAFAFFIKKPGSGWRIPYVSLWWDMLRGKIASYTWRLPVTSVLAQQAGIQMWGFPKTLEDIRYEKTNGQITFTIHGEDGQEFMRYSMPDGGTVTPKTISPPVYSVFEGAHHVSHLTQAYENVSYVPRGGTLTLGDHPLVEPLKRMGLPRKPLIASWMGHLNFSMSSPKKL